jgi:hypothetical protein
MPDAVNAVAFMLIGAGLQFLVDEWRHRRASAREDRAKAIEILAPLREAVTILIARHETCREKAEVDAATRRYFDTFDKARSDLNATFGGGQLDPIDGCFRAYQAAEYEQHDHEQAIWHLHQLQNALEGYDPVRRF